MDDLTAHLLASGALAALVPLALAMLRWLGLLLAAPILGPAGVTVRMRMVLAAALAAMTWPAVAPTGSAPHVTVNGTVAAENATDSPPRSAESSSLVARPTGPRPMSHPGGLRVVDLSTACLGELVIGLALGFGIRITLTGLSLAGELIDQQAGLGLAQVFDPASGGEATITGQSLLWTALAALLLLEPLGGHLLLAGAMLDVFEVLPVAAAVSLETLSGTLVALAQQSLVLALQVAAPLLAVMSLVTLASGWLARTTPQVQLQVIGIQLRGLVSLLVLALSASGMTRVAVERIVELMEGVVVALS
jgi:flagellar biosynthetic protein FliR